MPCPVIKKKLQGIPRVKKYNLNETEQASEPDIVGCLNYQTRNLKQL